MSEVRRGIPDDVQQANVGTYGGTVSIYVAIAFRWGCTNNHQYHVYAGDDQGKALALAENERDGRGGKYGVAVYEATHKGESLELRKYYPSGKEEEPMHNFRIDYFERLGHVLDDLVNGHLSIPDAEPDARGITGMHRVELEVDPILRAEVQRHRQNCEASEDGYEKARAEAAERAARTWCPVCDATPVYSVEYTGSFWRTPRDETSGEIEVDGLEGNWCRRCEQLHVTPEQITRNQHKVWMARHRAITDDLETE